MANNDEKPRLQAVPKDRASIQAAVEERRAAVKGGGAQGAAKKSSTPGAGSTSRAAGSGGQADNGDGDGVDSKFVRDCLAMNQLGDGALFAQLNQGRYVFNKSSDEWIEFDGHSWKRDILDRSQIAVETTVVQAYLDESERVGERLIQARRNKEKTKDLESLQGDILKRVSQLRSTTRVDQCLRFASTCTDGLAITGDELDTNPYLFGVANGVIDLETGRMRPGKPCDWVSKASRISWQDIEAPAPTFERFVSQILGDNDALVGYVQRLLGHAMLGHVREHVLPCWYGAGRNGKGTLIETMAEVFGDYYWQIQAEMLLDQRAARSSSGPSADIMSLRGRRLVVGSEPTEGSRWHLGRVKLLTGGDRLTGRNPNDKYEVNFAPSHTLILLTNTRPAASAEDFAFWKRLHLVPFEMRFVDDPQEDNERQRDPHLIDSLKQELPGILAWLVRGCIDWQQRGLEPPPSILEATAEYRQDEDLYGDFIAERCVLGEHMQSGSSQLYQEFREWFAETVSKRREAPSQKKFGEALGRRRGVERIKDRTGRAAYRGIGLRETTEVPDLF